MRTVDLFRSAVSNTLRAKVRTSLTVIAIFIGAFTLTLTSGVGTGVNRYIDDTVAGFGDADAIFVQKSQPMANPSDDDGPREYDPESAEIETGFGVSFAGLSAEDIETIRAIDGVEWVAPMYNVTPTYLANEAGDRFELSLGAPADAAGLQMVAGEIPAAEADEVVVPDSWVEDLGFSSAEDAVGATVEIVMTDMAGKDRPFEVTVSGVTQANLAGTAVNPVPSTGLQKKLYEYQVSGGAREVPESYMMAVANVEDVSRAGEIKAQLADEQMIGVTVEDQLGMFKAVINGIVWILNSFAIIALLAAGFGIVNTLMMSVQERTREIGLMKAMGMSGGKVFGLFSLEAVFIGFLGSAIGAAAGIAVGSTVSRVLSDGLLSGLPGLSLFAFDPGKIALIVLAVMAIAFLAGTVPAVRAARKDPITALRYE